MRLTAFKSLQAPPGEQLGSLMTVVAQSKLTALGEIASGPQTNLLLLIKEGILIHGYQGLGPEAKRILPRNVDTIPMQNVVIQPMPVQVLQYAKILIEHAGEQTPTPFDPSEFQNVAKSYEKSATATLLHLNWKTADAFLLVPGGGIPNPALEFVSAQSSCSGEEALKQINNWGSECQLTVYPGSLTSEAWLEMHIKTVFHWSINLILDRYGYLTGKLMVTSIKRDIVGYASRQGWDITSSASELVDRTIYESSEVMAIGYQRIMAQTIKTIQTVVGTGMMSIIIQQISNNTNETYRKLIQYYRLME